MTFRAISLVLLAFTLAILTGCTTDPAAAPSESTNSEPESSQSDDPPTENNQAGDDSSTIDARTPEESLQRLKDGNADFVNNRNDADISAERRKETATDGQFPYAVVVTCSDSRVPPEHIFNAGIGDVFVIRTAGNVVGQFELGSIEYGVEHLGAPLVVVLGHTNCGAVKAALEGHAEGNIQSIVDEIALGIGSEKDAKAAAIKNASHSIERIGESEIVAQLVSEGSVELRPALYDIETGEVTWL